MTYRRTIYLSGPITGVPYYAERFAAAAERLREPGVLILNPATIPPPRGLELMTKDQQWSAWMRPALTMMLRADEIHMLPGWMDSTGAKVERELAVDVIRMAVSGARA